MSDTYLLITGIGVFGLMLIGVVLTALEYRQLEKNDKASKSENHDS